MARIQIEREHQLSVAKAKKAVDSVADAMRDKFQINAAWKKDVLSFERAGVSGKIAVDKDKIAVDAELGFMLGFLKGRIEQEINAHLDQLLS
jgi:putative polyhydroxyalkanoate system protein